MAKASNSYLRAIVDGLLEWGIETFVYVPSSHAAPVIRDLEGRGVRAILANREEEAVGIAGGLRLAGARAAIVMQDNGFGNALTALGTFAVAYHVGIPIVANSRGGIGEYNSMIQSISGAVPRLLEALTIPVLGLTHRDPVDTWRSTTAAAATLAEIQRRPVVTLFDALDPAIAGAP